MSEGLCSGCSIVVIIIKSSVIIYIKVNLERVTFFFTGVLQLHKNCIVKSTA